MLISIGSMTSLLSFTFWCANSGNEMQLNPAKIGTPNGTLKALEKQKSP